MTTDDIHLMVLALAMGLPMLGWWYQMKATVRWHRLFRESSKRTDDALKSHADLMRVCESLERLLREKQVELDRANEANWKLVLLLKKEETL